MHLDVIQLRDFYYRYHLGATTQRALQRALRELWPDVKGQTVAGYGFAAPFLRPFKKEAARVLCFMPAQQGACQWPREGPNLCALVDEDSWPIPTGFVDRLILAHGLETCDRPHDLLEEVWRVLAPSGKVLIVAPNRAGLWARRETTPFAYGRPYSYSQLESQLRAHRLEPQRHAAALYAPPSHKRFWLRSSAAIERVGRKIGADRAAGVLILEATKQVYALPDRGARQGIGRRIVTGLAQPAPKPVTGRGLAQKN